MTVRRTEQIVYLEGLCTVEEAETLVTALEGGTGVVDLAHCDHLHGALVQAILAFRPEIRGEPRSPFLRDLLRPALISSSAGV